MFLPTNAIHFTVDDDGKSLCFRGGILSGLHEYALSTYKSKITDKFQTSENITGILEDMKNSEKLTVRQYFFAAGLGLSYKEMKGSSRTISSDDAAKTMFSHLVDLIKPTCTDIMLDITGPGSVNQLFDNDKDELTGKLELAYTSYRSAYNYSLVLIIEMKSCIKTITLTIDSNFPEELQLLGEMAYCMKVGCRDYVIGLLFIAGYVSVYLLCLHDNKTCHWTKLSLKGSVFNEFFSVGHEIEQLIYHSLHNTLHVEFKEDTHCIKLETRWKSQLQNF